MLDTATPSPTPTSEDLSPFAEVAQRVDDQVVLETTRLELQHAKADLARLGAFLHRLAEALGVAEEWGGGVAEDRLLAAAVELKALAGPDARVRFAQVRDLVQDAHATACLGSGAQARERLAEASVLLAALAEGRV